MFENFATFSSSVVVGGGGVVVVGGGGGNGVVCLFLRGYVMVREGSLCVSQCVCVIVFLLNVFSMDGFSMDFFFMDIFSYIPCKCA